MLERLHTLFFKLDSPSRRPANTSPTLLRLEMLENRIAPTDIGPGFFLPQPNSVSFIDRLYMTYEAQEDQQNIILGQLAMHAGSSPSVQLFGFILLTDHQDFFNGVQELLHDGGVPVPSLSPQNIQNIQQFGNLTGQQFDNKFTTFMIQDNLQNMLLSLAEERVGSFELAKPYAATILPTLETHLLIAMALVLESGVQSSNLSSGS